MFAFRKDPGADGVGVAFTDRHGGVSARFESLNLGRTDDDEVAAVVENYRRVREELGVTSVHVVHQVHGVDVHQVSASEVESWNDRSVVGDAIAGHARIPVADAQVTDLPGVAVAVRVADCLPVLFAAPAEGIVAAAHAGRVGLLAGVLQATVGQMRRQGATRISAWIGPHICRDCYEVPAGMAAAAAARNPGTRSMTTWGTTSIDLGGGAEKVLSDLGIEVVRVPGCTRTSPDLYSHRRDGSRAGRQVGIVWLADESLAPRVVRVS